MSVTLFPVSQSFPNDLSIRFCRLLWKNNAHTVVAYAVSAMEMYAAKASAFDVVKQYIESSEPGAEVVLSLQTAILHTESLDQEIFISMFQKGLDSTFEYYLKARHSK